MMKKLVITMLSIMIIIVLAIPSVSAILNYDDYKIENYSSVYLLARKTLYCDWKPNSINDGYKECNAEISIYNKKVSAIGLLMNANNFKIDVTQSIKDNVTFYYSTDFEVINDIVTYTNWKVMDGTIPTANINEYLGLKATFELPQYASAQYNFTYLPLSLLLDPDISACGNLVGSGTYNLTQNLTTATDCLKVKTDDITINMNGYTITGDGGSGDNGIENTNKDNLIINGEGTITNFYHGIDTGGDYGTFNRLTIDTANSGIYLGETANNNVIENNNINQNNNGIYLYKNSDNLIKNNILNSNTNGIFFYGIIVPNNTKVYNISVINNTIENSGHYGIYSFNGHNNTIINNTIYSSAYDAIYFSYSSNNVIINNDIWNVSSSGTYSFIYLDESSYNTFEDNRLNYSLNYGIWLKSASIVKTSSHNLFKNMDITDVNNIYVLSTSTGFPATFNLNNTFLNVTYNNESIDANSQLVRQWYYKANVTYLNGTAVENVILTYYNVSNDFQFSLTTDANGLTDITGIIDYVNVNQNKGYYSNYTIYADKTGCEIINFSYNVSENLNNLNHIIEFSCIVPVLPVIDITLINPPNNTVDTDGLVDFRFNTNVSDYIAYLFIDDIFYQSLTAVIGLNNFTQEYFTINQTIQWKVNTTGYTSETFTLILNLTNLYVPPSPRENEYVLGVCPVDTLPRAMLFMFFVMLGFVIMGMGYTLRNGLIGTIGSLFLIGTGVFMWYCLAFVSLLMMALGVVMMSMFIFKGIRAFR